MYSIFLENQHVKAQVGWYQKERAHRVDLWVSINAQLIPENVREELTQTLDYAALVGIVITESSKERKLLETLALDIAHAVEQINPAILKSVEVVIRKKHVAVNGYNADGAGVKLFKQFK